MSNLPIWMYESESVESITSLLIRLNCNSVYGFAYELSYPDGTYYIGKKNFYTVRTVKATKNGIKHENTMMQMYKNVGHHRVLFDVVKAESNWKEYCGSAIECKDKIPSSRTILSIAFNKLQLTYDEVYWQILRNAITDPHYINSNILGKFYRGSLETPS